MQDAVAHSAHKVKSDSVSVSMLIITLGNELLIGGTASRIVVQHNAQGVIEWLRILHNTQ
jgi:hypothetical protein